MTRRHLLNLAAVAPVAGFLSGFRAGQPEPVRVPEGLRWVRHESWQKKRRGMDTAFLRGVRSDGAAFTVAAANEPGVYGKLLPWLDEYLAYPMAHGDAFATGKASGYRA